MKRISERCIIALTSHRSYLGCKNFSYVIIDFTEQYDLLDSDKEIQMFYYRRFIPENILEEGMKLLDEYMSQFTEEQMEEDFDDDDFHSFIDSHSSEEYKLWRKYESFTGDEGELLEKDGSFIIGKDGYAIQKWTVDDEGYLYDMQGNPIFYSDGERVKEQNREDFLPYIDKWFSRDDD